MSGEKTVLSARDQAVAIWQAAVKAADPRTLIPNAFSDATLPFHAAVKKAPRILVMGGGKAGAAMSVAVEEALMDRLDHLHGIVNVPAESVRPLKKIRLHAARPAGTNHPTREGVEGAGKILDLAAGAGPEDVGLCLISGGGSALLPAPVEGVTLEDKQKVTKLMHACGATINEMNTVRKHLSRIKGGGLARTFTGKALFSLIISDVVGDPLDVIASGPTAADPTTFADALAVLRKYSLQDQTPPAVLAYMERGVQGEEPETLKTLPAHIHNMVLGNNAKSLAAAQAKAEELGYRVLNLGSFIEGETRPVAELFAFLVHRIKGDGVPMKPPVCLLSGGETTVTLPPGHGKGGRNQEFVLALALALGESGMKSVTVLSGGTDGEDGPTDAAGAVADESTLARAARLALFPASFLATHNAYAFFDPLGDLLKTGLTNTNVMDVRVILVG